MIISHKHKFIFFKTRKTAGSSIQVALAEQCGKDDIITGQYRLGVDDNSHTAGLNLDKFPGKNPHTPLKQVKEFLDLKTWNSYFKFAFIRNPFDIVVSRYYWEMSRINNPNISIKNEDASPKDFREWVKSDNFEIACQQDRFGPYIAYNGEIAVNAIGHYENLNEGLEGMRKRIGLEPIKLPKLKSGLRGNGDLKEHYDEETEYIVKNFFKSDFEAFYKNK